MKCLVLACLVSLATAVVLDPVWVSWKQDHNKQYEDEASELHRYSIWKDNLANIEAHNRDADKHGYTLGINEFSDLTTEEFSQQFGGLVMSPDITNSNHSVYKVSEEFVPDVNVDWRRSGAVSRVYNQGNCQSCWAFSATGALEGQEVLRLKRPLLELSEQNLVDCTLSQCNPSHMINGFLYIINNKGVDTESSYPYTGVYGKCRFSANSVGATMSSYKVISKGDVNALTFAISNLGPISVGVDAHLASFKNYRGGVYKDPQCTHNLNHAMLAVGYGTTPQGEDYFLLKNTWGTSWGIQGYMMLKRDSSNLCGVADTACFPVL